jgi:NADH-quinone oxidoreductase subunit C
MNEDNLANIIKEKAGQWVVSMESLDMLTLEVDPLQLLSLSSFLQSDEDLQFTTLVDVCCVDYSDYGVSYWRQGESTSTGYSRGVQLKAEAQNSSWTRERFVVVYHLLSLKRNQRLRMKVYVPETLKIRSVIGVWSAADWYEREAFDLFGVSFEGHPDLRRIMTDYGFKGHPFRKDFPLIGEVEMRYDATKQSCVYEPVTIQPRVLVPKVIRSDNRYCHVEEEESNPHA